MMIGGEDIILYAPAEVPAVEVALGRFRRFWHDALIQDPNEAEEAYHAIRSLWAATRAARCRELLIYRDRESAESWDQDGMTPENANSMICLIVGEPDEVEAGRREVTIVCNERTEAIEQLVRDLESDFQAARPGGLNRPRAI